MAVTVNAVEKKIRIQLLLLFIRAKSGYFIIVYAVEVHIVYR